MVASTTQSNNTISLNDQAAPIVTNVTSTKANGSYSIGEVIPITVTFNKVVNVTGIPQITLETGSSDAVVNYSSGTGSNTLTFNYTVAAGHNSSDLDYVATTSLALNSGTIKDAALNVATLTLASPGATNSLGANKALIINNAPVASNVSAATVKNTNASIHLVASDADYNNLTYSIVSNPSNGTATLSGKTVTYAPTTDFSGTDTFTFKANDGIVDSATKTVTIKVIDGYQAWTQLGSDLDGEATSDQQGSSISLSSDGTTLAVGAYMHDSNKGTVRIYTYNGTAWSQLGSDLDGTGVPRLLCFFIL